MACYYCAEMGLKYEDVGQCHDCGRNTCGPMNYYHGDYCDLCAMFLCIQHVEEHSRIAHSKSINESFSRMTEFNVNLLLNSLVPKPSDVNFTDTVNRLNTLSNMFHEETGIPSLFQSILQYLEVNNKENFTNAEGKWQELQEKLRGYRDGHTDTGL